MAIFSYDDDVKRESLIDVLKDISPIDGNYLVDNLGVSQAGQPHHEFPVYNIDRAASVSFRAEGADFAEGTNDAPTRSANYTAILSEGVRVSGTEKVVNSAGVRDMMSFQKANALRRLKQAMEWALVNGNTLASGASGTARQMLGLVGVISTNVTDRASGTSMSLTELEDILRDSWEAVSNQNVAKVLLVPYHIKRTIATFTTRIQPQVQSTDTVYNNVGFYESNAGMVQIFPHKDVVDSAGSTHVIAINPETFKQAYLKGREPKFMPIAKVGDADRGEYLTEFTLESRAERASVIRRGYIRNQAG